MCSSYLTEHVNRFGDYTLNLDRKPPQAELRIHPETDRVAR
jgi:hypothetical protein